MDSNFSIEKLNEARMLVDDIEIVTSLHIGPYLCMMLKSHTEFHNHISIDSMWEHIKTGQMNFSGIRLHVENDLGLYEYEFRDAAGKVVKSGKVDLGQPCKDCGSKGFDSSILGPDRCSFCDGTKGGVGP